MWLWMTLVYPWPEGDGALLYAVRLVFRSAMVGSIVLVYALGLGAGTHVLTLGVGEVIAGPPRELRRAADGRGLGAQPRRSRMGHPQAAGPARSHSSCCCPVTLRSA